MKMKMESTAPGREAKAGVPHHDATRKMASYPRVAATRATLIRRSEPSKLAPPEDKARLQGDATSSTIPLLYDLVRRCLDYADCRGLGV